MRDQEINIAIAEEYGWHDCSIVDGIPCGLRPGITSLNGKYEVIPLYKMSKPTPETDAIAERLIPMAENIAASNAQYIIKQVLTEILIKTSELERERDEAREAAAKWEAVALREASINGARICAKEGAK